MAKLFNRAKMTTTTTGSGTITLGSASNGFQSFADAGVADGDVVQYVIEEGANFEIGTGTYSATGTSLTRTPSESSNSNNAIALAGQATVSITAVADDLNRLQHNGTDKVTVSSTGASVTGNLAVTGTVDGRDVASDGSKLDGIESGATADQTASEILTAIKTVDGAGSGLDADTLDGSHASAFAAASHNHDDRYYTETEADGRFLRSGQNNLQVIPNIGLFTNDGGGNLGIRFNADTGSGTNYSIEDGSAWEFQFNNDSTSGDFVIYRDVSISAANEQITWEEAFKLEGSNSEAYLYSNQIFHDSYHPNADKWTTSRTLSLTGGVTGSVSWDGSANATLTSTVALATASAVGGIKIGYTENGKNYPVELDGSGKAYVNVPWTDTDTNTNQLTTFVVQDGDSTNVTMGQGKYLKFAEGGGIDVNFTDTSTGSSGDPYDLTISHADTSSQGSVDNSNGTVIQDVTLDGYGHVTGLASVNLDGRYYTESEVNTFINRSYVSNHSASNLAAGWYTIAQNTGDRAVARFALWDTNSSDHQAVIFYASHHFGTDASNTLTVLDNSYFSGNPFRYIRIKDAGTYDGAALQVYIDDATNAVNIAIVGDDVQSSGWDIVDFLADATAPSAVSNWANFGERAKVDLNQIAQGGLATTGPIYADGDTTQYRVFNDNYHPNADKWTAARTLSLTGEASGSVSWDGSANASLNVTLSNTALDDQYVDVTGDTMTGALDLEGGSFSSGIDTNTNAALVVASGKQILGDDGNYLRNLVKWTSGNQIEVGQGSTSLITGINLLAGSTGTVKANGQRVFAEDYHPNADKWTTARTVSLTGDVTGSASIDGSANASISTTITDTALDDRYQKISDKEFFSITNSGTTAGTWLGSHDDITAYFDGMTIAFYQNGIAGASTTTININNLGAKTIYYANDSKLTTHYGTRSLIMLQYDSDQDRFYAHDFYYSDYNSYQRFTTDITVNNSASSGVAVHGYQLLLEGYDGKFYPVTEGGSTANTNTVSTAKLKLGGLMLQYDYSTDANANATLTRNELYIGRESSAMEYWNNRDSGWATADRPVYLVGTVQTDGSWKLDNTSYTSFLTQTLPTSDDGKIYVQIGMMGDNYDNYHLYQIHPIFIYKDGGIKTYSGYAEYAAEAAKWATSRTLSLTGEVTGSVSWDGSANASISTTLTESPNFSTSLTVDGHTLQDSSDRSGLLELTTSLGTWRGIQIKPTSTSLWSIMGDQDDFGLYDDYNSEWIMLYNENSTLQLYGNGSNQLSVGSTYVEVAGQIRHMGDTDTYMEFHNADEWRVVTGGTERLEVNNTHVFVNNDFIVRDDAGIYVQTDTNGAGAKIKMSDRTTAYEQNGTIEYLHQDGSSYGSGNAFKFYGTESSMSFHVSGHGYFTGDVATAYSDERLKDFDGKIEGALDKLSQLNGYYYHANDTAVKLGYDKEPRQVGVSAQEVEAVMPEVIAPAAIDPEYKTVHYDRLVPLLIEAIKEQQTQIDALKAEIEELKR